MPLPVSKSQVAKLGERLVTGRATGADWNLYAEVLDAYDQNTTSVRAAIDAVDWSAVLGRPIDLAVTARTKTLGTLLDKLMRTPAVKLPAIRDISGVRIVGDLVLSEQDVVANHLIDLFECQDAKPVDRRAEPMSGYRALHIVIVSDGLPVEVQIRTELQALWADLYERLADTWGRQIRYGEAPLPGPDGSVELRAAAVSALQALSVDQFAAFEHLRDIAHRVIALVPDTELGPVEVDQEKLDKLVEQSRDLQQQGDEVHAQLKERLSKLAEIFDSLA
ncbi:nucleotidyltransferase family protein [Jiangella rhizosphaerae]|nr:hypothetical protein [Jiangella rhizosphaerae]